MSPEVVPLSPEEERCLAEALKAALPELAARLRELNELKIPDPETLNLVITI